MAHQDEEYDALVAAPKHHRLLFENETVRVLETKVEPGDTVPLHSHILAGASYFISFSHIVRRNELNVVEFDSRSSGILIESGTTRWQPPLALHTLENVGETLLHVITTEIKS